MLPDSKPRRIFKPALWPTLAVIPVLAILIGLSYWQYQRALQKSALDEQFAHSTDYLQELPSHWQDHRYERIKVSAVADWQHQILLDNMTHDAKVGYRVLVPLQLVDGRWVLLDRGFIEASFDRHQLPDVTAGLDLANVHPTEYSARIDNLPRPGVQMQASAETGWPRRVNFPSFDQLSQVTGHPLVPLLLLLDESDPRGYVRDWKPAGIPMERHLGYSLQWAGLAITLFILYILSQRRVVISDALNERIDAQC